MDTLAVAAKNIQGELRGTLEGMPRLSVSTRPRSTSSPAWAILRRTAEDPAWVLSAPDFSSRSCGNRPGCARAVSMSAVPEGKGSMRLDFLIMADSIVNPQSRERATESEIGRTCDLLEKILQRAAARERNGYAGQ
jgi:hypothetical protein